MILNKSLQVRVKPTATDYILSHPDFDEGGECPEHERRTGSANVQKLSVERALPP